MKKYLSFRVNGFNQVDEAHDEIYRIISGKNTMEALNALSAKGYELAGCEAHDNNRGTRWIVFKDENQFEQIPQQPLTYQVADLPVSDSDVYHNVMIYLNNKYPVTDKHNESFEYYATLDIVKRLGWQATNAVLDANGNRMAWGPAHPQYEEYKQKYGFVWGVNHPDEYPFYHKLYSGYSDSFFQDEKLMWDWVVKNVEFVYNIDSAMSLFHNLPDIHVLIKFGHEYIAEALNDYPEATLYKKKDNIFIPMNISIANHKITMALAIALCWLKLQIDVEENNK